MKHIYTLFLGVLAMFCITSTHAQTLQPSYGAPAAAISVCDGNAVFKIKVIGSSSPCAQGTIDIVLPAGYNYVAGSAIVSAGSGTVSENSVGFNTATLKVLNLPASPDSTVISYQAYADCSTIGTLTNTNSQAKYTLNSPCLGSYIVTSNTFNTQSAALSITSITNSNYTGAVGDVYTRAITIANNGLGTVSQITVKDTSGNGFFISNTAVSAGWVITQSKTVSGTDTISTYLLSGPHLLQGQSVVLTENIKLVNKCYLQTKLNAYFGCNGNACTNNNVSAVSSAGATVNSSLTPALKIISQTTALVCRGMLYPQTVGFANTGSAPLYQLAMNIFSSTWSAVPGTQYFNATRTSVSGGQSAYANFQYKKGVNGSLTAVTLDSMKSFTTPGSSIIGMPSSVYITLPVINPGDTIYITYNELNSPLPGLNSGNTLEMSGGLLRYTYADGCGITSSPADLFIRSYQQIRMNTLATVPANMQQAQSYAFTYYFSESNTGIYTYAGADPSSIRFDLVLPNNIDFSGNASDITLLKSSVAIGAPTGFSYAAATHTASITYPVTAAFNINTLLGATLSFNGLTLNCAATSNGNTAKLNCYVKAKASCSNTEFYSTLSSNIGFICPVSCGTAGGLSFNGFSVRRTNYGLPDNNNDGIADGTGSVDFTKVKTDYVMMGDTVEAAFYGRISVGPSSPATGFQYGYAVDTFSAYNSNFSNLYATVQLYASGNNTPFYTCNNVPVSGGTGTTRKVDFSISALNAIGGCTLPALYTRYNDGDSVVVKLYYRVSSNIGGTIGAVTFANKFLVSNVANPAAAQQYSCGGKYTGAFSVVGIGNGNATGNLTYSITGIATALTQASNMSYLGPCCTTAGSKPFVYEYRSVSIYDSMSYVMPPGYNFVSANVSYTYTKGPNLTANKTAVIVPVNPLASTLVFNIRALFENGVLPYGDQGSSITATVTVRPNCAAAAKATANFYIRQIATPGNNSGLAPYAANPADTIYYTAANLSAIAASNPVSSITNTVSWDVQLSNSSVATASSVWMGKDAGASGVTITSVQKLSGAGGAVTATLVPTGGGIYQLGSFGQTSNYYRINASYTSCVKDSINLAYGYDCNNTSYPGSVAAAVSKKSLLLSVTAQQASLQVNILSQPDPLSRPNLCDTLPYTLEASNAGPGSVSNVKILAQLPASGGVNFIPGTFFIQYPSGSGPYINIPDVNVTLSGSVITFSIPAAMLAKLDATQACRVKFGLQTNCSFASGQSMRFSPTGISPCGQTTTGITQQSEKVQMAGVPATTNLYGISSRADTAAQACMPGGDIVALYYFKIVNQGPLLTSTADAFSIQLPAPWQLDTNSVSYSHNIGGAAYTRFSGGIYYFSTGVGVAAGDSVVLTVTIRVPAPQAAAVPTGLTGPITENALVIYNGYCSSAGMACPASQVIVSTNQTTVIPVAHPLYSITGFSLQQNTSKDTVLSGTISIAHTNTLYTPHNLTVKLYKDLNANNIVDGADLLLGQQVLVVSSAVNQRLKFNINSIYAGNLCPGILVSADFGCYALPYVYSCASATANYSNAGTIKNVIHCNDNNFVLSAVDTEGKWVVDSGTAIIANGILPATSATVNPGNSVRLLWFTFAAGTNGSITVFPDTIRLINNALPVITALLDNTVCAGDSVAFSPIATVANATITYQWAKDGLNIPGATSNPWIVGVAVQAADAGLYTVTATGNNGCASTASAQLTVNPLPVASIAYTANTYCNTGLAAVTQTGQTGGIYSALPAGLSINAATGALDLAASTTGTYTVTYNFTNGTCGTSTTATITINPKPVVIITNPPAVCAPGSIDITAASITAGSTAGLAYSYYADAAATSALTNPSAITTSGVYYIKGSTSAGCSDTQPVTVTINAKPILVITNPAAVCSPATVDITAAAVTAGSDAGLTYTYFTDAGAAVPLINPSAVTASGTYYIKGVTAAGCSNIHLVTITINVSPLVVISNPPAVCAPATVDITKPSVTTGSTPSLTFNYFTDADAATSLPNANNIAVSGTYYIKGITSSGCSNTQPVIVTINTMPFATISYNSSTYCTNGTAVVIQTGTTGGGYAAAPAGLSINAVTGTINLAASLPGQYTINYTYTNGACTNTATTTVTTGTPNLIITNPVAVCAPATVNITAAAVTAGSDQGLTFFYYSDAAVTVALANPAAVNTSGIYYIKGINANACPTLVKPVTVVIHSQPAITVTADSVWVCKWAPVVLTAVSAGNTITWQQAGAGNPVTVYPGVNTTYTAMATDVNGCTNNASINIAVRDFNLSLLAAPNPILAGNTVTLTSSANSSYGIIAWKPAGFFANQSAISQSFIISDTTKTFYAVAKSAEGCQDTASVTIIVDVNTKDLFIPNAFTPNGDGRNDVFKLYGSSVKSVDLKIFNQWGAPVFETRDKDKGWDGTTSGHQQPAGIFIYQVKVTFYDGNSIQKSNTINLIR